MSSQNAVLVSGRRAHLIGIGGVSMSALADVLSHKGLIVSGSDVSDSPSVQRLVALGIPVHIGHDAALVQGADCVIRTAAARDDNIEVAAARQAGIPVLERAEVWGFLMREYRQALCIAGTHGKTTTTSMATSIAMEAALDPTVMIGGGLPLLGSGHRVGHGDLMIMEACEYCNSFLKFYPTLAVILNIEADHLDFFKDLNDIMASFRRFALLTPDDGTVIVSIDDEHALEAVRGIPRRLVTFGTQGDIRAEDLLFVGGFPTFSVMAYDQPYAKVELKVPGLHNVSNALAAAASAYCLGVPGEAVSRGLGQFGGATRRFEWKGDYHGARVVDDYAHHPSEIAATLQAARGLHPERIVCVFQPHTYSRTQALFSDFADVLKAADVVILTEIYAAREDNPNGISAKSLADAVSGAVFCPTLPEAAEQLRSLARPGDLILTVGAGNVVRVGEMLLEKQPDFA